jgi:hypothetical protein
LPGDLRQVAELSPGEDRIVVFACPLKLAANVSQAGRADHRAAPCQQVRGAFELSTVAAARSAFDRRQAGRKQLLEDAVDVLVLLDAERFAQLRDRRLIEHVDVHAVVFGCDEPVALS